MFFLRFRSKFINDVKKLNARKRTATFDDDQIGDDQIDDDHSSTIGDGVMSTQLKEQSNSAEPSPKKLKKNVGKYGAGPKCEKKRLAQSNSKKRKLSAIRARSSSGEFTITDQPSNSNDDDSTLPPKKRQKTGRPRVKKSNRPQFVLPTERVLRSAKSKQ